MGPKTQSDASVVGNRLQLTFKERRGIFNSSGAKQTLEVEFQDSDSATKALLKLMGQKMDNSGQQGQQSPSAVELQFGRAGRDRQLDSLASLACSNWGEITPKLKLGGNS